MQLSRTRAAMLLACFMLLGWAPAAAQQPPTDSPCSAPVDPAQARLDAAGIASASAGGLALRVARQCAGFSVVAQEGVEGAATDDYVRFAEHAYSRLAEETGVSLLPRAVVFVFVDEEGLRLGEQVVGGSRRTDQDRPTRYATMNTIWVHEEWGENSAERAQTMAHEFSHLFSAAVARGRDAPSWFEEGLAVHSELTLTQERFPVDSEIDSMADRGRVLGAMTNDQRPLFELGEISSGRDWLSHWSEAGARRLQYAQSHELMRWVIGPHGRAAAWEILRQYGRGAEFDAAFEGVIGLSPGAADAHAREAWHAELVAEPDPLKLRVELAAIGGGQNASVDVEVFRNTGILTARATLTSPGAFDFEVLGDGTLVPGSAGFEIETEEFESEEETEFFLDDDVSVRIRRGDLIQVVGFERSFGRWVPRSDRYTISLGERPRYEPVPGPLTEPFPSGDRVIAQYPRR